MHYRNTFCESYRTHQCTTAIHSVNHTEHTNAPPQYILLIIPNTPMHHRNTFC